MISRNAKCRIFVDCRIGVDSLLSNCLTADIQYEWSLQIAQGFTSLLQPFGPTPLQSLLTVVPISVLLTAVKEVKSPYIIQKTVTGTCVLLLLTGNYESKAGLINQCPAVNQSLRAATFPSLSVSPKRIYRTHILRWRTDIMSWETAGNSLLSLLLFLSRLH